MPEDFEARLVAFAERTMRIRAHCSGEDATRIYLVMPFLELLGYDASDPAVVVPEHEDAIDFAVMIDRRPAIVVEAVGGARSPSDAYDRLRAFCSKHDSVKIGVATNGVLIELFVDSRMPGQMDDEPFLRIDLAQVAVGGLDREARDLLSLLRATTYHPEKIAEQAYVIALRDQLKRFVLEEFRQPSEPFCRLLLERIGIKNPRTAMIDEHYRPIMKAAMEQAIILPVLTALRRLPAPAAPTLVEQQPVDAGSPDVKGEVPVEASGPKPKVRSPIGERLGEELATFGRARRRSA